MQHFENGEPQHVAIDWRNPADLVVLDVATDALVDLRQMRQHSVDQRLRKSADAWLGRTEIPEVLHLFGRAVAVHVTPKMKLDGRLPRDSSFAHTLR